MQSWDFDYLSESQFENFPEIDISEDDRVYIYAVTTRLRRILNWIPDDENQLYDRRRGHEIMRELLSHFHEWKGFANVSEAYDAQRMRHLVIFSLARLALYYWITDTTIVAEVLTEIFECDGHFSSIFAHVVNKNDRRSLLRQTSNYSRQREDSATIFFLHHAQKAKLEFRCVRFQDLCLRFPMNVPPVFLTVIYSKPHILLHLLRFGAKVDVPENRMSDEWNLPMLLRHLIRVLWNYLGEALQHEDVYCPQTSIINDSICQISECLCILLRVIPQIRMGEMNFLLLKFDGGVLSGSVSSHDFIRHLSTKNIVPKLVNRYMEPSELQHLCRCIVRNVLNETWNLPYGIHLLPLPMRLKEYLSLTND